MDINESGCAVCQVAGRKISLKNKNQGCHLDSFMLKSRSLSRRFLKKEDPKFLDLCKADTRTTFGHDLVVASRAILPALF